MKYAFVIFAVLMLIGCGKEPAKVCFEGVTYINFGGYKQSHSVQLDRDSKVVPCD